MKKALLFSAAIAAFALVSCNKDINVSGVDEGKPVEVTVSIRGDQGTRATGTTYANEARVNTLQVFVFNNDEREAYRSISNSLSALIPATSGTRTVWAVVNAPDLSSVMSLSGLRNAVTNLKDNTTDSFVMTGAVTQELVDGGNVAITVKRIVARVSISRISTSLKDYRSAYSVQVKGIYLINAGGANKYDVGGEPVAWANRLGHTDTDCDALLYDALTDVVVKNNVYQKEGQPVDEDHAYNPTTHRLADGVTIVQDNGYTKEHVFYPYPNIYPIEGQIPVYEPTWSPRGTLLVIEAVMLDGSGQPIEVVSGQTTGYYPIILPAIERNKTYAIDEVRITRLPGDVPYKPIETGETQVTITVAEWETGVNLGTFAI